MGEDNIADKIHAQKINRNIYWRNELSDEQDGRHFFVQRYQPGYFTKADRELKKPHCKQIHARIFAEFVRSHFVLSGFTSYLTSHFVKSFSNHSYGYDLSNDLPNCFASYTVNSGSLMNYAG